MKTSKSAQRKRRHRRVRAKIYGTTARPRLCVYKSNTRIVAQIIDDERGMTVAAISSSDEKGKTPMERAENAAKIFAKRARETGVSSVVFDRGGFKYVGTVKAFADAAREAGLKF